MEKYVIVSLILLLVVAFSLFIYLIYWKEFVSSSAGSDVCKISVLANIKTGGIIKQNCKTIETTIKEDDDEKVKKKIASMMYTCWDQFGQGNFNLWLNPFGEPISPIQRLDPFGEPIPPAKCFVCYKLKVNKKVNIYDMTKQSGLAKVIPKWFSENTYLKNKYYHDFFSENGEYYVELSNLDKDIDYAIVLKEIEYSPRGIISKYARKPDEHVLLLTRFDSLAQPICTEFV